MSRLSSIRKRVRGKQLCECNWLVRDWRKRKMSWRRNQLRSSCFWNRLSRSVDYVLLNLQDRLCWIRSMKKLRQNTKVTMKWSASSDKQLEMLRKVNYHLSKCLQSEKTDLEKAWLTKKWRKSSKRRWWGTIKRHLLNLTVPTLLSNVVSS